MHADWSSTSDTHLRVKPPGLQPHVFRILGKGDRSQKEQEQTPIAMIRR